MNGQMYKAPTLRWQHNSPCCWNCTAEALQTPLAETVPRSQSPIQGLLTSLSSQDEQDKKEQVDYLSASGSLLRQLLGPLQSVLVTSWLTKSHGYFRHQVGLPLEELECLLAVCTSKLHYSPVSRNGLTVSTWSQDQALASFSLEYWGRRSRLTLTLSFFEIRTPLASLAANTTND